MLHGRSIVKLGHVRSGPLSDIELHAHGAPVKLSNAPSQAVILFLVRDASEPQVQFLWLCLYHPFFAFDWIPSLAQHLSRGRRLSQKVSYLFPPSEDWGLRLLRFLPHYMPIRFNRAVSWVSQPG